MAGFLSPELTKIMVKTLKEENDKKYKKKQNEIRRYRHSVSVVNHGHPLRTRILIL
jgi:hypothetical protein